MTDPLHYGARHDLQIDPDYVAPVGVRVKNLNDGYNASPEWKVKPMTPIERAARALCNVVNGDDASWECYVKDVHAVLAAIREPKGAMIDAGARLSRMSKGNGDADIVLNRLNAMAIYTAMIDAALGE